MREIKLKITGIHCKSCKELIENEISLLEGVENISVDEEKHTAEIEFNEKKTSQNEIINEIKALNYEAEAVLKKSKKNDKFVAESKKTIEVPKNFFIGGALLLLIGVLYYVASKSGAFELMGKLSESSLSYPLIFLIGLLASFHCIGMCGGIVMAYTSRFCATVKGNKTVSFPHIYYNLGRILSYTLTGFILGGVGSFFGISRTFTGTITILAGLFMIAVGLSLITRYAIIDKITAILPTSFARLFSNQLHASKPKGPFIIGFLNGFMPCGPLQALQVYALTSGSALTGGISMAMYGLGTAPLMLGFGKIISLFSQSRLKQVMRVSGIIVILLGLMTANRGLGSFNWNDDNQSAQKTAPLKAENLTAESNNNQNSNYQVAQMDLTYQGYVPNTLTVKKGVPVKWIINAKEISGCTSEILLPAFKIDRNLKKGENIIEFTPQVAGTYKFSCGMQMVWGKFVVTE